MIEDDPDWKPKPKPPLGMCKNCRQASVRHHWATDNTPGCIPSYVWVCPTSIWESDGGDRGKSLEERVASLESRVGGEQQPESVASRTQYDTRWHNGFIDGKPFAFRRKT